MFGEPGAGEAPVAFGGGGADVEQRGGVLRGETGEEAQFNEACGAAVNLRESGQGLVQGEEIGIRLGGIAV